MERPDEREPRDAHENKMWSEGQDVSGNDDRVQDTVPEISIFQASRDHYGVFYRLDIIDAQPELRVMIPVEHGAIKMDMYLVRLSERMPLTVSFAELSAYQGSNAYEHGRETALQHMLYAVAEMMKQLFWSGDLSRLSFPLEIEVRPLLRVGM